MTQNLAVWLVSGKKFGSGERTHVAVTQTSRRRLTHLNLCSLTDDPLFLRVIFTSLLSDALCFAILDTSWRWSYVELIFCAWPTLLGIRTSRLSCTAVCDRVSFHSEAEQYCLVCAYHFISSCVGGHLGYFYLLAMVNNPKHVYTAPVL